MTVHQKINAKNNMKHWGSSSTPQRLIKKHYANFQMYLADFLLLERPGVNSQRNFDYEYKD